MLRVRLLDTQGEEVLVTEVDFVSLVNSDTFGAPPLIAPKEGQRPLARVGQSVLFINTSVVQAFEIERLEDLDD